LYVGGALLLETTGSALHPAASTASAAKHIVRFILNTPVK
jgi:hypothetical protein